MPRSASSVVSYFLPERVHRLLLDGREIRADAARAQRQVNGIDRGMVDVGGAIVAIHAVNRVDGAAAICAGLSGLSLA